MDAHLRLEPVERHGIRRKAAPIIASKRITRNVFVEHRSKQSKLSTYKAST
jgi:hypothetical protein